MMTRANRTLSMQATRICLKVTIYLDAFKIDPATFLRAVWWFTFGKRLRAKFLIAPLLGKSRSAYQYWRLYRKPKLQHRSDATSPTIVAIIDISQSNAATLLEATKHSLAAESIAAFTTDGNGVLSTEQIEGLAGDHSGIWVTRIAAGDLLARGAGDAYRTAAASSIARVIYADDDVIGKNGKYTHPHFKPSWNDELFKHLNFMESSCIINLRKTELIGDIGEYFLRDLVKCKEYHHPSPQHIPHILHHRRHRTPPALPTSTKPEVALKLPSISVIIPTRNRSDLLKICLEGLDRTDYADVEVLIIDNDSDDPDTLSYLSSLNAGRFKIIQHPGPFNFSGMNNIAVAQASGEMLCFLNNDIEITGGDWLKLMAAQAQRPDVGAVGAQLLYPDGRIQHAGVIVGIGGAAAHAHRLLRPTQEGYFQRHALPQFVSAVTAACLVVRRDRFLEVGGFDEVHLPVAFNDVDLCLKLNARGWKTFYEPRARLYHHESVSRGLDRDIKGAARLASELKTLQKRWGTANSVDPYHHPALSRFSEQFVLDI